MLDRVGAAKAIRVILLLNLFQENHMRVRLSTNWTSSVV